MMSSKKTFYLYDPRTNVSTETSYDYLARLTGRSHDVLRCTKSRLTRIRSIGCYIIDSDTTVKERRALYEEEEFIGELWHTVAGSDGTFLISNHGRVKRVFKTIDPKFSLPYIRKQNDHLYAKVRFNGVYKEYKIAHLVAHHFIGPNKANLSLCHKNGIKTDCFAGNLQYISKQKLGKLTGATSRSRAVIQLCPDKLVPIEEYRSAREAGRETFVSYQAVLDNCNNKTKLAGGYLKFVFAADYKKTRSEQEC